MATSTREGLTPEHIEKGYKLFEVVNATIVDSLGAYCVKGEMGVFDKELARTYLDQNHIKVDLPKNFDEEGTMTADEVQAAIAEALAKQAADYAAKSAAEEADKAPDEKDTPDASNTKSATDASAKAADTASKHKA